MREYTGFTADVGSEAKLAGALWPAGAETATSQAPTVLAIHGITATHMCWPLVTERLPGVQVIAPDLRGRGRSNLAPEPWSMIQHADDMVGLLDEFGVEQAVVLGHSMGAFVASWLAARHPERVSGLVLVDGGLPLPFTPLIDIPLADLPALMLGPAGERLTRLYPTREAYLDSWRAHPGFASYWNDAIQAYIEYDLEQAPGGFRTLTRLDPVAANSVEMDGGGGYREALSSIGRRVDFLHAPRGLMDGPPLYPGDVQATYGSLLPGLVVHEVSDVNHYGIVLTASGADHVGAVVGHVVENSSSPELGSS